MGNKITMRGSVVLCSDGLVPVVVPPRGLEKKITDISKVCSPRCIRTVDRAHLR